MENNIVVEKQHPVIVTWEQNFVEGTEVKKVPLELITVENGLKETRLFALKKTTEHPRLIAIIVQQIKDLIGFLNLKETMSSSQMFDTAELILDSYDDFSFTAIMDCFKKIKTNQSPFSGKFYQRIDGRVILSFFDTYREFQSSYMMNKHQDKKATSDFSMKGIKNEEFAKQMSMLKRKIIVTPVAKKKSKPEPINPVNEMTQEWLREYDQLKMDNKLPKKITGASDYLRYKQKLLFKPSKNIITHAKVQRWATEFSDLREEGKLPKGINTYTKYFEYKAERKA